MIITIFTFKNRKNSIFKQKIGQESENDTEWNIFTVK